MPSFRLFGPCAALMLLLGVVGCGTSAPPATVRPATAPATAHEDHDHDHGHPHDEPDTFAAGVAKLKALGEDLADKLADDAGAAADDAVHGIGHVLEAVRELAAKEGLADAASKGLDELEECFGKVDEAFHSGDDKVDPKQVLESMKQRLEAAFTSLQEVK
jgi:hypothetical protein